jgi:hypothetical protein
MTTEQAYERALVEIDRLRAALEQAVDDFGDGHCVCEATKQMCIEALNG